MNITQKESFTIDDVLTWKDRADFNDYLDKEGYFADNLNDLAWSIHKGRCSYLEECDYEDSRCFKPDDDDKYFSMFLPKDKVHYPEVPKTRPFMSMKEFMEDTGLKVGDVIYLRNVSDVPEKYVIRLITGLNNDAVILGHIPLYFNTLFENQMYSIDGHSWKGFVHVEQEVQETKMSENNERSQAKELIRRNMFKGDDPRIDRIYGKGYFFDDSEAEDIVNIILRNPSTLKSCRYGTLVKIHGELVRCVYKSGEEFYWNYFVPEVIVDKVLELCSKK